MDHPETPTSEKDAAYAHFSDLYNRLGRTEDPEERNKIAEELAKLVFGC